MNSVETNLKYRLDLDFSHGICPDCMAEKYPEVPAAAPTDPH